MLAVMSDPSVNELPDDVNNVDRVAIGLAESEPPTTKSEISTPVPNAFGATLIVKLVELLSVVMNRLNVADEIERPG